MLPSAGDTTGHARAIGLDDPAAVGPIERPHPPRPLTAPTVLVVGLFIEIVIFVGLVWPLGIWRSPRSITTPEPLSDMLGQSASGLAHFVTTLVLWSMAYIAV